MVTIKKIILSFFLLTALHAIGHGQVDEYLAAEKKVKGLESKMKKEYQSMSTSYEVTERTLLSTEQSAWIRYRDAQLKIAAHAFRGGSGQGLEVLTKRIELTEERLKRLKFLKGYL